MQGGDPTGTGRGGESIYGFVYLSFLVASALVFLSVYSFLVLLMLSSFFPNNSYSQFRLFLYAVLT